MWKALDYQILSLLDSKSFVALVLVSLRASFERERIIFLSDASGIFSVQESMMQGGSW